MDRRTFVSVVAGGLVVGPLGANAQRQVLPVIGYLANASAAGFTNYVDAFRRGLGEMGYVEGQNVAVEYRWADDQDDRVPTLAADLVARKVDVIATLGTLTTVNAARKATATIPIVFRTGGHPGALGLLRRV